MAERPGPGIETIPSSAVRREVLAAVDDFEDIPNVFVQVCWIPALSQIERHRHTGMRELIKNLDEDPLDLILQDTRDAPQEVITLSTDDHLIIPTNRLHIIRNGTSGEIKILTMGIRTQEQGETIRE